MDDVIEKYGDRLVQLDLSTPEFIDQLIKEISNLIVAEKENNKDIRRPDYKAIMYFMIKQVELLDFIKNCRYTTKDIMKINPKDINSLFDDTIDLPTQKLVSELDPGE